VYWTLYNRWWALGWNDTTERARVFEALKKTAAWTATPELLFQAAILESRELEHAGHFEDALGSTRVAESFAKNADWSMTVLEREAEILAAKGDATASIAKREQRVGLAEQISPDSWVEAVFGVERARFKLRATDSPVDGAQRLIGLSDTLLEKGAPAAAAFALERASLLYDSGFGLDGPQFPAEMYQQRVPILDRLNDPLRSLTARVELAGAIRDKHFHNTRGGGDGPSRDPLAVSTIADIATRADDLANAGRARDAARAVARLSQWMPNVDVLHEKALAWAETFKDSVEYGAVVGDIESTRAYRKWPEVRRVPDFRSARDHYVQATLTDRATSTAGSLVRLANDETTLWRELDACMAITTDVLSRANGCVRGLGTWLQLHADQSVDKAHLARALADARAMVGTVDGRWADADRMRFRSWLAAIAFRAGDRAAFDAIHQEVRTFFTVTSPNPYMWVTHISVVAGAMEYEDPKLMLELRREFDTANGASDSWRASDDVGAARVARRIGDRKAWTYFMDRAEAAGRPYPYIYGEVLEERARDAAEKKNFKAAEKFFGQAVSVAGSGGPLELRHALAKAKAGDARGAFTMLKARLASLGTSDVKTPCGDVQTLEIAAAAALAAGDCTRGQDLRTRATQLRSSCTEKICTAPDASSCDGPDKLRWKGTNACKKAVAGEFTFE